MQRLEIYLEAQSPLLIGSGLAIGNVQSSREYVPGSVWRGAIAGIVLNELGMHKHNARPVDDSSLDPTFKRVFLGERAARFSFLYPVRKRADEIKGISTVRLPLTARTCKIKPGFRSENNKTSDGVYDGVMNRLRNAARNEPLYSQALEACPVCKQRLVRRRGFAARDAAKSRFQYQQESVGKRSFVRVGLNRYTETAQQGVLYVLDALVPGPGGKNEEKPLTFVGTWYGTPKQAREFKTLLKNYLLPGDVKGSYSLRIGTARARGMGQVCLELRSSPQSPTKLEDRLNKFQPKDDKNQRLDSQHIYAVLTLRSPLQLLDQHGFATTQVTSETLRAYHPNVPTGLELLSKYSVVEQEIWTGWSSAWGLPKPVAPAIAAGGVLIMRVPSRERDSLLKWLKVIEQEGLGERRAEGWGDVLVCDPFHIKHDEKYFKRKEEK